jgi:DNA polymerase elongation subunit (family B)
MMRCFIEYYALEFVLSHVNVYVHPSQVPDSNRDAVYGVVYVFARDPGGGESIEVIEKGAVLVLIGSKQTDKFNLGVSSSVTVEHVQSERSLLLRVASIVQIKDPDILLSWDTQGSGIGYLVERGVVLGKSVDGNVRAAASTNADESGIDIARLLGRIPKGSSKAVYRVDSNKTELVLLDGADEDHGNHKWTGSGLGSEWDDRVGAGGAAASIVSYQRLSCIFYND